MPRRNNNVHPSLLRGGPEHGDSFENEDENLIGDPDDEEYDDDAEYSPQNDGEDSGSDEVQDSPTLRRLQEQVDNLKEQNKLLARAIPPREPVRNEPEEEEVDWEHLLFSDPAKALELHGQKVAANVEARLRKEYQQDKGAAEFWRNFYKKHKDLREEDDLVQFVMQENLGTLGGMEAGRAMDELADLTRKRILRYSGKQGKSNRSRAVAEGASSPSPARGRQAPPQVKTLADVINNRRAKRRAASAA
jgi:hypothetical protein